MDKAIKTFTRPEFINTDMSPSEFRQICKVLHLSRAASARYLGYSERQAYRWAHGTSKVPSGCAVLLRTLLAYDIKVDVLKRNRRQN